VQRWLGHHSPAFTLARYVHLLHGDLGGPLSLPTTEALDDKLVETAATRSGSSQTDSVLVGGLFGVGGVILGARLNVLSAKSGRREARKEQREVERLTRQLAVAEQLDKALIKALARVDLSTSDDSRVRSMTLTASGSSGGLPTHRGCRRVISSSGTRPLERPSRSTHFKSPRPSLPRGESWDVRS
jgi:hypothetical protein